MKYRIVRHKDSTSGFGLFFIQKRFLSFWLNHKKKESYFGAQEDGIQHYWATVYFRSQIKAESYVVELKKKKKPLPKPKSKVVGYY